ncbi:DUF1707 domain-containing protein [Nocardia sp. NBC_01503]|uniref:DUF1707 domain-containing protein n=1 Tax=Nocardia sp. NBC_01503 TaxID=2975997 RepID=UPI002E7AFFFF|nr:DUF1707 domain-containing protein [Nocardia sp. NBC_01503]WTL33007.1 DUF1707 domain-containing protein [Nocardia sp. NBC_01503]
MSQENMRASDADREQIVTKLRVAMDDGRINLHEFDERVQQVYAARTYGELTPVLADLPAVRSSRSGPKVAVEPGMFPTWVKIMWTPWVFVNILCVLIWLATGMGYFWPFWVAVPWGLALFIPSTVGYLVNKDGQRG